MAAAVMVVVVVVVVMLVVIDTAAEVGVDDKGDSVIRCYTHDDMAIVTIEKGGRYKTCRQ
jgi:hypothetical protein